MALPKHKNGVKTTEFFVLVMISVMLIANGSAYIAIHEETLRWFIGACMAYIGQRGYVKGGLPFSKR